MITVKQRPFLFAHQAKIDSLRAAFSSARRRSTKRRSMTCTECGGDIGAVILPTAQRHAMREIDFTCAECVEKIAKSEAIMLDSETNWGKLIAKAKGR